MSPRRQPAGSGLRRPTAHNDQPNMACASVGQFDTEQSNFRAAQPAIDHGSSSGRGSNRNNNSNNYNKYNGNDATATIKPQQAVS
jgi:hypothetical protein